MIGLKKTLLHILTVFALLLFSLFAVLCMPAKPVYAHQNDDWEEFNLAVSQMFDFDEKPVALTEEQYKIEDEQLFVLEDVALVNNLIFSEEKNEFSKFKRVDLSFEENDKGVVVEKPFNRLIVNSAFFVDDEQAVLSAHFDDWHVFQYENFEMAQKSYSDFVEQGVIVNFDTKITAEDVGGAEDLDLNAIQNAANSVGNFSYNSWGAKYLGWQSYTEKLLSLYEVSSLPDVYVAVVDSGINQSHDYFKNRISNLGRNFTSKNTSDIEDGFGHGTHVSGIIADATLDNVKFVPLRVLDDNGDGTVLMLIEALNYIKTVNQNASNIENNIRINVANMSLGIKSQSVQNLSANSASNPNSRDLQIAVENLYYSGVLPVVSAGNDHTNAASAYPANVSEAITVSALRELSYANTVVFDGSYSNYGSCVDFSAPGTNVLSAYPVNKTRVDSGTSMAAPHVTACYALLLSNPFYSFSADIDAANAVEQLDEITDVLKQNALDLGATGKDDSYGWGCVNVENVEILPIHGQISFEEISHSDTQIEVKISYEAQDEDEVRIFYSDDPFAYTVGPISGTRYLDNLVLNKTTKLTATACVYQNDKIIATSPVESKTFYLNNEDLPSNFDIVKNSFDNFVTIINYKGSLTNLHIPETMEIEEKSGKNTVMKSYRVGQIGDNAFFNKQIETLDLPDTITYLGSYLFGQNKTLSAISTYETGVVNDLGVTVADDAFNSCSNLQTFEFDNVVEVGSRAFIRCESLSKLELFNVETIGTNALTDSGIEEIYIGGKLKTIGSQSNLSLKKLYGPQLLKDFADENSVQFFDVSLHFENSVGSTKTIMEGEPVSLNVDFVGISSSPKYVVKLNKRDITSSVTFSNDDDNKFAHSLCINCGNLSAGTYTVSISVTDPFYDKAEEKNIILNVFDESKQTYKINIISSDKQTFQVRFGLSSTLEKDFSILEDNDVLLAGEDNFYTILVEADPQYALTSVVVDGENVQLLEENSKARIRVSKTLSNSEDVDIEVATQLREVLSVVFSHSNAAVNIVSPESEQLDLDRIYVDRENNRLSFSVVANEGYRIRSISLDSGEYLYADKNGIFTIENITQNLQVNVNVQAKTYKISLQRGKGGTVSATGLNSNIGYGESRTYTIFSEEGYEIDYVLVNGKRVDVVGNKFTLSNVTEDINIFVSFKLKNSAGLPRSVIAYFVIFSVLFVAFAAAKIVVAVLRKKQKIKK